MTLRLGIDTGGTYTDAVLVDEAAAAAKVMATAKSLTTRHDLAEGIRGAVSVILKGINPADINLVSVSTTLATNAVVEGYGAPSCLVLIGQPERVLERARLGIAVGSDPVERVTGAFEATGTETEPLDTAAIENIAREYGDRVSGFAVAGYFAVRNPTHEIEAARILESITGRPVTASHYLSASLDAPRRALTALFNSRLIPLLNDLIEAVESIMREHGIEAPLMVVQGDGSLVAARAAIRRPVETILSGPAASVIGARFLGGVDDAVVSDIGGTTTDVAVIRDGQPEIDTKGALIGDWHTMVRAVTVQTSGLGGDSEVGEDHRGAMTLGPRRAIPLVILAASESIVAANLKEILSRGQRFRDGAFGVRLRALDVDPASLTAQERATWEALGDGALDLDTLFADPRREKAFNRLRRRGLVGLSTFTPTDAAHVLGKQNDFDLSVARDGADVWARRLHYPDGETLARAVHERLIQDSARALVETAMVADGTPLKQATTAGNWFVERSLGASVDALVQPALRLSVPVVGIGAPARTYYPAVAERLGVEAVIPEHAEVCNAVGAAVAAVVRRVEMLITAPAEGRFRVHADQGPVDHDDYAVALEAASRLARNEASRRASEAGASAVEVELSVEKREARGADGTVTFIECRLTAVASGTPATD